MSTPKEKLQQLITLRKKLTEDKLTTTDVEKIFKFLTLEFKKTDKETKQKTIEYASNELIKIVNHVDSILNTVKRGRPGKDGIKGDKGDPGKDGKSIVGKNGRDGRDGIDGRDGADGIDGTDAKEVEIAPIIDQVEKDIPKLGNSVRDALELLVGRDRLSISAIKGLKTALKKSIKKEDNVFKGGVGGAEMGGSVRYYDLSSSLDGSTRTFPLPAFARILQVNLSSFPNILRPDVDYTVNGSDFKITFTAEISLNAIGTGQSCLILYANQ